MSMFGGFRYNNMPPRSRRSKDEFELSNPYRLKVQKADTKEYLRTKRPTNKNLMESPQNSDDEQYHQKVVNQGVGWWNKVQYRFFRRLQNPQMNQLVDKTTTQQLLQMRYPAKNLLSFYEQYISAGNLLISNPCVLKVLFRREIKLDKIENYQLVMFHFKEYKEARQVSRAVPDRNLHLSAFRVPRKQMPIQEWPLQNLDIDIVKIQNRKDQIQSYLHHDVLQQSEDEINMQTKLWQKQFQKQHTDNTQNWSTLKQKMNNSSKTTSYDQQVSNIHRQLRMAQVLLHFKRGHGDKTEQMLQQAMSLVKLKQLSLRQQFRGLPNTRMQQLKNLFQTDCKICFCTQSDAKNLVVYCDHCNTSFHQACYGLQKISQDKFYCQVCTFLKLGERNLKKPSCQLCGKSSFPMKQIKNHFYHVTCLVLFGMVEIKNYRIQFKPGYAQQVIMQKIVQNELSSGLCSFCLKENGMKLQCAQGCGQCFHPICAYLNGVHFELKRNYRQLQVKATCALHHKQRDTLNQIYLRRFFCDHKGTSNMTDAQFAHQYNNQLKDRALIKASKERDVLSSILRRGRASRLSRLPLKLKSKQSDQYFLNQNQQGSSSVEITQTRKLYKKVSLEK